MLRLSTRATVITSCCAIECTRYIPKSFSTIASAMPMPAVIPAEVQTLPSVMKMRFSSTLKPGSLDCNSLASCHCVDCVAGAGTTYSRWQPGAIYMLSMGRRRGSAY